MFVKYHFFVVVIIDGRILYIIPNMLYTQG